MPKYALYPPPSSGLPYLAIIFDNGQIVACEAVASTREGKALLDRIKASESEFLAEARKARH